MRTWGPATVSVSIVDDEGKRSKLGRYKDLLLALTMRDVRVRYQQSILGIYWAVLNPLMMALVWALVFTRVLKMGQDGRVPYVVFLFCSLSFWGLFSNSATSAVGSLTGNASLLAKASFPRMILPTASVSARIFDLACSGLVLAGFMIAYRIPVGGHAWLALPLVLLELVYALGFAYLVAGLNVLFRDVQQILPVLLLAWMYVSPVLYSRSKIPSGLARILHVNTPGALVGVITDAVLGYDLAGAGPVILFASLGAVVSLVVGLVVFRRAERLVSEVL